MASEELAFGARPTQPFQHVNYDLMLPRKRNKREPGIARTCKAAGKTLHSEMQKVQASIDPKDNISVHSSDFAITRAPDVGQPFGGEENWEPAEDDPYNLDLAVMPDDSISARDVKKRRDAAKMSEREMAELRRLIQGDDRFGRTLERTCQAIFECVQSCNPGPILTLLASLVWRSLCIAWELESSGAVPKTHLRSKISELQGEQRQVQDNLDDCRSCYLKELTALRDQLRRMNPDYYAEIRYAVYEEDPVMYYEPLKYLDEKIRIHVAEVVEEKLKLILSRLEGSKAKDLLGDLRASVANDAEKSAHKEALAELESAKEKERQMRELYEALKGQFFELEERINFLENEDTSAEAELSRLMSLAGEEWEAVSAQLQRSGEPPSVPPWAGASMQSRGALSQSGGLDRSGTLALDRGGLDRSGTLALDRSLERSTVSQGGTSSHGTFVQNHASHLRDLLLAEKRARQSLQALLKEKEAALEQCQRDAEAAAAASAAAVAAHSAQVGHSSSRHPGASAAAAAELQRLQREAEEQARARELAEKNMERLRDELARLRAELAAARANQGADSKWQAEKEEELAKANALIKELRAEIERLKAVIADMVATGGSNEKFNKDAILRWRAPTGKVFDRLFQDSIDREERRRALELSLEQARDEKALEIFRANMLTFQHSYTEPTTDSTQELEELRFEHMTDTQIATAVRRQHQLLSKEGLNMRDVLTTPGTGQHPSRPHSPFWMAAAVGMRSVAGFRHAIHQAPRGNSSPEVYQNASEREPTQAIDANSRERQLIQYGHSQSDPPDAGMQQSLPFGHSRSMPAGLNNRRQAGDDASALQIAQLLPEMLPAVGSKHGSGHRPSAETSREVSPETLVSALQGASERKRSASPGVLSVDGLALSAAALGLPPGGADSREARLQLQGRSLNRSSLARERSRSPQLEADRVVTIAPTMAQVLENPRTPPEFEIAQCDATAIREFKTPFAASMASAGRIANTPDLGQQVALEELWRPPLRRSESQPGSRPGSAGSAPLRAARETITARPRSAALPSLMRVSRSEAALNREAQRVLADPSGKLRDVQPLRTSDTAPSIRTAALNRANRRMRRVQSASR